MWKTSGKSDQAWLTNFLTTKRSWSTPQHCQHDINSLYEPDIHINGKIYWFADGVNNHNEKYLHIVCFDVEKNEFHTFPMPEDNSKKAWKLSSTNKSLAIVGLSRVGGIPYYTYEVWRLADKSVNASWWERILILGPVSANLQFMCFSEGRCVFSEYSCNLYHNDSKCAKKVYYVGRGVQAKVKEIRGKLPFNFAIDGCTKHRGSLTNF